MKSIYASKLFKTSKRKDRIKAAVMAPSNLGLVQQLAEDLDDEYKEELLEEQSKDKTSDSEDQSKENNEFDNFIVDEDVDPENDLVTMNDIGRSSGVHKSSKPSSPKSHEDHDDDSEHKEEKSKSDNPKPDKPKTDTSDLIPESPANEKPKPTESSTHVDQKENIKASFLSELNVLKDTLNSRQDTAGVTRIAQKEKELWIYYNDDVNLNDIMVDVIECIMKLDFNMIEFNRLARSDNAIVFVITVQTSNNEKSIDSNE
jgi:hypothetical protein